MKQLFLVILLSSLSVFAQKGLLVVSNNGENQALIVEADSLRTVAAIPIGTNPHDIAVSSDGRFAYIAIMGTRDAAGNTIEVIDLENRSLKKTINLGKYKQCHDVRVSKNGKLLWTTCAPSKAVLEIDTDTGKILKTWDLTDDGAWMLVVTPDERKIYTANLEGKSVSVINRKTNKVSSIKFQSGQIGIDVSPDGNEVWVHHIEESKVSVIDARTDKVLTTFPSNGKSFGRLKFTSNGKYVLVPQSESKNMTVFDAKTRQLVADIPLSFSPKVITISADSQKAFLTSPPNNKMMVIDLQTFKEINAVPMGKNTDGIAFTRRERP